MIFPVIERFIESYEYQTYWGVLAKAAKEECENKLSDLDISAKVTFRQKSPERLKTKLYERNEKRKRDGKEEYKSSEDIYGDIFDFAGVRIALPFKPDESRVAKALEDIFRITKTICHPKASSSADSQPQKSSSDYHAIHLRVEFKSAPRGVKLRKHQQIEVQIVPQHVETWSTVEHDLLYKNLSGPIPEWVRPILDMYPKVAESTARLASFLYSAKQQIQNENSAVFEDLSKFQIFCQNSIASVYYDGSGKQSRFLYKFLCLPDIAFNRPTAFDAILKDIGIHKASVQQTKNPIESLIEPFHQLKLKQNMKLALGIVLFIRNLKQLGMEASGVQPTVINEPSPLLNQKCRILLSTIIWLIDVVECKNSYELTLLPSNHRMPKESFIWLCSGACRGDIVTDDNCEITEKERADIESVWEWSEKASMEKHGLDGLFGLLFQLAKMGMLRDLPDEIRYIPYPCGEDEVNGNLGEEEDWN